MRSAGQLMAKRMSLSHHHHQPQQPYPDQHESACAGLGSEEHTNYVVTAFSGATIPTGSYTNGTRMRWLHRPLGWEKAGAISTSKA